MAFKSVFAFSVLFLFTYCEAKPENCSEARCKLMPVREGLASEFRSKASEKGVRLVYLNLKIGNDGYDPLESQDLFLPHRWVWASKITEPMLSLPEDYDILSLGLLNYQVRSMEVHLEDQPNGCLANLNSTRQNTAIGRMLLENVTSESSADQLPRKNEVVCVSVIQGYVVHRRCWGIKTPRTNGPPVIQCDLPPKNSSDWYYILNGILIVVSLLITYYLPAFPLILPDYIFSLQYECDKEDQTEAEQTDSGQVECAIRRRNDYEEITNGTREEEGVTITLSHGKEEETGASEIPVDDSSPVTCSALLRAYIQKLPDSRLSFNIKLAVMLYLILPCVFYVQMGLWLTFKRKYIHESFKKHVQLPGQSPFSLYILPVGFLLLCILPALACLPLVLFSRPKDLLVRHDKCFLCKPGCCLAVALPTVDFPRKSQDSIGNVAIFHLRRVQQLPAFVWSTLTQRHILFLLEKLLSFSTCSSSMVNRHASRMKRAQCMLCALFSTLLTIPVTLFGALCLSVRLLIHVSSLLIWFSPYFTLTLPFQTVVSSINCCTARLCNTIVKVIFVIIIFLVVVCPLVVLLYSSTTFVRYMLRFIIIGLSLNTDIATPYVAFFLAMTTNIYLCYGHLQKTYKEFKGLILKYMRQRSLNISNGDQDTIPTSLFWFVSDRVLPIATETCRMVCNMGLIMIFSCIFLSAVLFFKNTYSISAYVSTVSLFVSGMIPALFFKGITKGKLYIGWGKIKMKREIEIAVEEFDRERNGANSASSGGTNTV